MKLHLGQTYPSRPFSRPIIGWLQTRQDTLGVNRSRKVFRRQSFKARRLAFVVIWRSFRSAISRSYIFEISELRRDVTGLKLHQLIRSQPRDEHLIHLTK